MSTQFKFATYNALVEAGKQASQETRELELYLQRTSSHGSKKRSDDRTSGHRTSQFVKAKKDAKVIA
ncbi:hypothetical protein B7R77_09865 [Ralstonia solanacearum K60]|uniref:Uncharacterized protein n=1 Tax=Ralstonia solanacearum K60 TaxID=1091042 RepID=A0AAP7ZNI3_RALSL|nr:hypothetical protein [Ralstonia solanacearum]OYQ13531.1 hypothetical protein B7R77_09865 [Ralstonia solanacearum K60]RIJ86600.1 hypothetical protein RSP822_08885 [Ralstonia solanacearum]CCF97678.1 hypothetical protein RSK60_2380003 [Ralstonia solanacearum K60]